jgi:parallel beta-helix repeat protein
VTDRPFVGVGVELVQEQTIYGNETWHSGGTYIVQGDIRIARGGTLTIEPGVTVKFDNMGIDLTVEGNLFADDVLFTALDESMPWGRILFSGFESSGSYLKNCTFNFGGQKFVQYYGYSDDKVIWISYSSPTIENCTFEKCNATTGIKIDGQSSAQINGNTFKNFSSSYQYALQIWGGMPFVRNNNIDGAAISGIWVNDINDSFPVPVLEGNNITNCQYGINSNAGGVYRNNTLSSNDYGFAVYMNERTVVANNVFAANGLDILVEGNVPKGETLIIPPGSSVYIQPYRGLWVEGVLEAENCNFTWKREVFELDGVYDEFYTPGGRIAFYGEGAKDSIIRNCTLEHMGETDGPVIHISSASPTIENSTISNADAYYGLRIDGENSALIKGNEISGLNSDMTTGVEIRGGSPELNGNSISSCNQAGINVNQYNDSSPTPKIEDNTISECKYGIQSISGGSYLNNKLKDNTYGASFSLSEGISIDGNDYSGNEIDMILEGVVSVNQKLTIPNGSKVHIQPYNGLFVNGTLEAENVTFTWKKEVIQMDIEEFIEEYVPGGRIVFSGEGSNNSYLRDCTFEHMGQEHRSYSGLVDGDVIIVSNASPTISGSIFSDCNADTGIKIDSDGAPLIDNNTIGTFTSDSPICIEVIASSPNIANNKISGCEYGINVDGESAPNIESNVIQDNEYGIYTQSSGVYTGNVITGNTEYGMFNPTETMIDAKNNDWGDPSGPKDSSDDIASGGFYNPSGLGDNVSDHIDYTSWSGYVAEEGDVNGDTKIDMMDIITALKICAGISDGLTVNLGADVNGDSQIGQEEALFLLPTLSSK